MSNAFHALVILFWNALKMRFLRLKQVVEVDRCGSITGAAKVLNTTQSTLTKSVAAMEQELGFALFVRRARGIATTEKGREFLTRASRVLSDYEHLVEDSRREQATANALLRIGICPAMLQGLLNRAICNFVQRRPEARVHLQGVAAERGTHRLHRGDVDLLIGPIETLSRESEFRVEKIPSIEADLYVRKGHELTKKKKVTQEDIRAYPIVAPDPINPYTDTLLQLLTDTDGLEPMRQLHIVEYFPIVSQMVETTDAVSVISKEYAKAKAFRSKFQLLNTDLFPPMEMGCAWRTRWMPSPAARSFIHCLNQG